MDIAVIGGGVFGVMTAIRLPERVKRHLFGGSRFDAGASDNATPLTTLSTTRDGEPLGNLSRIALVPEDVGDSVIVASTTRTHGAGIADVAGRYWHRCGLWHALLESSIPIACSPSVRTSRSAC